MTGDAARDVSATGGRRVPVDPIHPEFDTILEAANIIRHGGVVAYPTETFYGLGADPFSGGAVERLFRLKGREAARPLILLITHADQVLDLATVTGVVREWYGKLTRAFWPGPLTLVLPARARRPCPALAGGDTVAVRISGSPVASLLARTLGLPLTSTSANLSGGEPACRFEEIEPSLAAGLDLILDAGPTPGGAPSTILDLTGQRPAILRQGAITADQIARVIALKPRPNGPRVPVARAGEPAL